MSPNNNVQVTYCSFPPPVPTIKFYTCYKKEVCCQQGCCVNGPYQVYQVWYYWLLFLIIFGIISGGSWLCKKPRAVPCRTVSRNAPSSSRNSCCSHSGCNRRRCGVHFGASERRECSSCAGNNATDFEDNIILDRLFVSFRNRNTLGDPPSYSSILSSEYNNKPPAKFCPLYSYYGPPPTYSSMYKSSCGSSQMEQFSTIENRPNHSAAGSGVIQIQVHAEEHGNKPITDGNNENHGANSVQNDHPGVSRDNTNLLTSDGAAIVSTSSSGTNGEERNENMPDTVDTQLQICTRTENM